MNKNIIIALSVAGFLIILYVIMRNSKNSPISNNPDPIKTTQTTSKGLDWQGIGGFLGGFNPLSGLLGGGGGGVKGTPPSPPPR